MPKHLSSYTEPPDLKLGTKSTLTGVP